MAETAEDPARTSTNTLYHCGCTMMCTSQLALPMHAGLICTAELLARCDAALESLKRPASSTRPNVREELLSSIRGRGVGLSPSIRNVYGNTNSTALDA